MNIKIWLIIAAVLLLLGSGIFAGALAAVNWDFSQVSTVKYETNTYETSQPYQNITIETDTADITFVPSESTSVVCFEENNAKHTVKVENNTLVIQINDTRKWYQHIGIQFDSPKLTVYLPQGQYGDLAVKSHTGDVTIPMAFSFDSIQIQENTGDVECLASATGDIAIITNTGRIRVENITANSVGLSVSTGDVFATGVNCSAELCVSVSTGKAHLTDIACDNFTTTGNTGDLTLKNVVAAQQFSILRTTGDVSLNRCDAQSIYIKTDTGDVTGSLLSEKVFITQTDTGDVNVPKTAGGGKCEVITSTGDIQFN